MDDCLVVLKYVSGGEGLLVERVKGVLGVLRRAGGSIGLSFDNDKAQLLLPKSLLVPPSGFPRGLVVRSGVGGGVSVQGIEVVGSPVGSLEFCKLFVERALSDVLRCRDGLSQLHPQCAVRLLTQCVSACPAFLSQVCRDRGSSQEV